MSTQGVSHFLIPSGFEPRLFDQYSKGLGFKSQLGSIRVLTFSEQYH